MSSPKAPSQSTQTSSNPPPIPSADTDPGVVVNEGNIWPFNRHLKRGSASSKPTVVVFTDNSEIGDRFVERLYKEPVTSLGTFRENPETIPECDFIFSCWYDRRIPGELLRKARIGGVNIHPAYLPFNRGRHSTFWAIMDGTPFGATLHWMDETLDTGDIIAQQKFYDDGVMSAQEAYNKQVEMCFILWDDWLPRILDGTAPRKPQVGAPSSRHSDQIRVATEFLSSDVITMERLLLLSRATCFGEHGIYVFRDGRKFKIQAKVTECSG